jgi:geranylgeranyl pyrophosphate synthase
MPMAVLEAASAGIVNEPAAVYADLEAWLPSVLDDPVMRAALEHALRRHRLSKPPLRIADRVFAAITGRQPPIRLTSTVALFHVGAGLHDDVSDGEVDGGRTAEAQALLTAGSALASIAPQAAATLVAPSELLPLLHVVWHGLQAMASGQRQDLALFGASNPHPRVVEAALVKTTAECGMYAALGACTAGAADKALVRWERLGAEIGYALQVSSDCKDAMDPEGQDIVAGARTLPIALALQAGTQSDREQLRTVLASGPRDETARARARSLIAGSGSLHACGTLVEAAIARAERLLDELAPPFPQALSAFIDELSWLRRR